MVIGTSEVAYTRRGIRKWDKQLSSYPFIEAKHSQGEGMLPISIKRTKLTEAYDFVFGFDTTE